MLSCAEAVCATLHLVGYTEQAVEILSKFGWGDSFWSTNEQLFDLYSGCTTSAELKAKEQEYQVILRKDEEERIKKRDAMMDADIIDEADK